MEASMVCVLCKTGQPQPGTVTVTLERNRTVIVFKEVPADICQNCGEYYLSEAVTRRIYQQAEEAVQRNAEVEVLRYAA
jgi:YgiT-type zinc finger domain-containing protein